MNKSKAAKTKQQGDTEAPLSRSANRAADLSIKPSSLKGAYHVASPIPPALICTSITEIDGGFTRVEAADNSLVPKTFHYDMTPEELEEASISVDQEINVTVHGVWTGGEQAEKAKDKE